MPPRTLPPLPPPAPEHILALRMLLTKRCTTEQAASYLGCTRQEARAALRATAQYNRYRRTWEKK